YETKTNSDSVRTLTHEFPWLAKCRARAITSAIRRKKTEHPHPLGRRHRLLERQRLQPRDDGLQNTEHRSDCERRRAFHRLVWSAKLHRRARSVYHRSSGLPNRSA